MPHPSPAATHTTPPPPPPGTTAATTIQHKQRAPTTPRHPAPRSAPPRTPPPNGALIDAYTVARRYGAVGVDPHPPRRPPIHHLGRGPRPSPPEQQRRRLHQPLRARSAATADGVWVSTLTCSATSTAWKSSGGTGHRLGHHHQPPPTQQRSPDLPNRKVESIRMAPADHTCPPDGGRPRGH